MQERKREEYKNLRERKGLERGGISNQVKGKTGVHPKGSCRMRKCRKDYEGTIARRENQRLEGDWEKRRGSKKHSKEEMQ